MRFCLDGELFNRYVGKEYKLKYCMKNKTLIISVVVAAVLVVVAYSATKNNIQPKTVTSGMMQNNLAYSIKSDSQGKTYVANTPTEYSFSIVDSQGNTLKNFEVTHTKLLHLIVVRKDLAYFQHVHPDFATSTDTFTLSNLTFPADGQYRIFAEFAPAGSQMDEMGMPMTVEPFEDVTVGSNTNYTPQSIGTQENTKTFSGLTATLTTSGTLTSGKENTLTYTLTQNGKPVTNLQPYLAALGHAVILREGNLDYTHAHPVEDVSAPQTGKVDFMVDFSEAGTYEAFTQFQLNGSVITTNFVMTVVQGTSASSSMQGMSMSGMDMIH